MSDNFLCPNCQSAEVEKADPDATWTPYDPKMSFTEWVDLECRNCGALIRGVYEFQRVELLEVPETEMETD